MAFFQRSQWDERTRLSASTAQGPRHFLAGIVFCGILFLSCTTAVGTRSSCLLLGSSLASLLLTESCGNHIFRRLVWLGFAALEVHVVVVVAIWMLWLILLLLSELMLSQNGSLSGDKRHSVFVVSL